MEFVNTLLVDEGGIVKYVGQTNCFARRELEHAADELLGQFRFEKWHGIDDVVERLVSEQQLIDHFGGPGGGQLLNKINAIGKDSPWRAALQW